MSMQFQLLQKENVLQNEAITLGPSVLFPGREQRNEYNNIRIL